MFLILTVEEVDWASYSDTVHLSRAAHTLCQKKRFEDAALSAANEGKQEPDV